MVPSGCGCRHPDEISTACPSMACGFSERKQEHNGHEQWNSLTAIHLSVCKKSHLPDTSARQAPMATSQRSLPADVPYSPDCHSSRSHGKMGKGAIPLAGRKGRLHYGTGSDDRFRGHSSHMTKLLIDGWYLGTDGVGLAVYARWVTSVLLDLAPKLRCEMKIAVPAGYSTCLLYTSPSPRDRQKSRMPSSA